MRILHAKIVSSMLRRFITAIIHKRFSTGIMHTVSYMRLYNIYIYIDAKKAGIENRNPKARFSNPSQPLL